MSAITITILLSIFPFFIAGISQMLSISGYGRGFGLEEIFQHYFTWYLFLIAFMYKSMERNDEIKRLPSVFDFARFSLSTGERHPRILAFKWKGKSLDVRQVETLVEPGLFFFIGLFLMLIGQSLGTLLFFSSIFYSLSYMAAYMIGDHFVMDKIDEMICNEEMVGSFVEGRDPSETRGFSFYGRKPTDPETRRRLADAFTEDFEETVLAR
ncbi:MAG: hypothetical protein CFE21_18930 [Bacteroidetes bacterium B1(2017)]|nr:MAG: hypothetical protein CFE21_18930 [Bacteroidetes bacterium B1(2017)]